MKNIVGQLLDQRSKVKLGFGIHDNIIITKADGESRKNRDGSVTDTLVYLSFGRLNDEGTVVSESEIRMWPAKINSDVNKMQTGVTLTFLQLAEIFTCYYTEDQVMENFNPFKAVGITEPDDIRKVLNKKQNMDLFNAELKNIFLTLIQPFIGNKDAKFRLKVVTNEKGYDNVNSTNWIENMNVPADDSKLSMSPKELETYEISKTPKTGDNLSPAGAPATPAMGAPATPPAGAPATPGQAAPATAAGQDPVAQAPQASAPAPSPAPAPTPQPEAPAQQVQPQQQAQPQQEQAAPSSEPQLPNAPFNAPNSNQGAGSPMGSPLGSIPNAK